MHHSEFVNPYFDKLRNFKQGSKESVESYGNRVYDLIEMVNTL
jgi:hypothetical protein